MKKCHPKRSLRRQIKSHRVKCSTCKSELVCPRLVKLRLWYEADR